MSSEPQSASQQEFYIIIIIIFVACYAIVDTVLIGNLFYYNRTSRRFNYFWHRYHLHSLQSVHSNILILFGASGIHLDTTDR
jgi:hypothetical protein